MLKSQRVLDNLSPRYAGTEEWQSRRASSVPNTSPSMVFLPYRPLRISLPPESLDQVRDSARDCTF